MKRTWKLLAAVAALVLAVGCQKREPGRLLAVTYQTMDNPFFVDLDAGLREVIQAHGDRLVTLDAQWDDGKQLNDISDMVLRGAAGIFVNPVDWQGIRGSLLKAKEKGVPCIVVDAPAKDKDLALCTVASDNVKAGRLAGEALVKELAKDHRPGNIAILHHSLNKACLDRVAGFREVVDKRPDMKVIVTQEGKGTTEGARPVMQDLIERRPEINAVFAINDPSALGAVSALAAEKTRRSVTIVTVDGSQEGIEAVLAGKILSTSAQFPKEIGRTAAQKFYEHLEGKPVEPEVTVRVELITKENAGRFRKTKE